jgi:hypothetical protein
MQRLRVTWSGSPVTGPGLTTFYLPDSATTVADVLTLFGSLANKFPPGITWTVPSEVDLIDPTTGILTGGAALAGSGTQVSTGTDTKFAAGVGARIVWGTSTVIGGRRVKGSTFLVPLEAYCYAADGTLDATNASQMQTAVNTFVTNTNYVIWHRPSPGGSDGGIATVTSGTIPDKVSTLRSRRV